MPLFSRPCVQPVSQSTHLVPFTDANIYGAQHLPNNARANRCRRHPARIVPGLRGIRRCRRIRRLSVAHGCCSGHHHRRGHWSRHGHGLSVRHAGLHRCCRRYVRHRRYSAEWRGGRLPRRGGWGIVRSRRREVDGEKRRGGRRYPSPSPSLPEIAPRHKQKGKC